MGRIIRGALVGFLFTLTVGVWPAGANVSGVGVTKPAQSQVMAGSYSSDGSPSGFVRQITGTATTTCNTGFQSVAFRVTGPSSYSKTFNVSPPNNNGSYTFNANWDTSDLRNGIYTVRIDVAEPPDGVLTSCGQSASAYTTSKLANPPAAPVWDGSPTAKSDGSANVTLSWKKGAEPDVVEYHIFRGGPDGTKEAIVSATNPGSSGCTLSSNTYTCTDPASNFPSAYDGNYSYLIKTLRTRPAYNSSEDPTPTCTTNNDPCVVSAGSDVRQVTLTAPTPSPSPSPTGSPTTGPSPSPGGSPTVGVRGLPGTGKSGGNTNVLSFGGSGGGGSGVNGFYSGTYDENLPYQPKTLIVGDGTSTPGTQVEAAAVTDAAPNFRTIMLPVAGGLLAFLSAAHVRRLLVHF
jgi:hypothetical protein